MTAMWRVGELDRGRIAGRTGKLPTNAQARTARIACRRFVRARGFRAVFLPVPTRKPLNHQPPSVAAASAHQEGDAVPAAGGAAA